MKSNTISPTPPRSEPLPCGLNPRDFVEAASALSWRKRVRSWWDTAPPPALEALVICCLSSGERHVENIVEMVGDFGGKDAEDSALRLIASGSPGSFWKVRPDGTLKLSVNGSRALLEAHIANRSKA